MSWERKNKRPPLADDEEKVYCAALYLLGRREYSCMDLLGKLKEKGAEEETAQRVICLLLEKGYVDDARFSAAFVRDRREFHPCGAALLRHELQVHGISQELIETVLEEEYDRDAQYRAILRLLSRWMEKLPEDEEQAKAARNKAIRRLLRKGFPQSMVLDALREIKQ